jgi:pimeloyl-ACP methyl ester carboxylesterase
MAFHYRGYAPSSGKPSAAALLADAPLIYDWIAQRFVTHRIVGVGFSIGTGVAAHLASRRELAGLILVTPFDSLETLASGHYRWLPVSLLLRHRMHPVEDLRSSRVPVALIAAEKDTLIPLRHARQLAAVVPNLVLTRVIAEAGHNDIYEHPQFRGAMAEALAKIDSATR